MQSVMRVEVSYTLLLLASPSVGYVLPATPWSSSVLPPRLCDTVCPRCCADALPDPSGMRMKELKAELDERGIAWRGTCFERNELESALSAAREAPPAAPPAAPAAEPQAPAAEAQPAVESDGSTAAASTSDEEEEAYAAAYESELAAAMKLRVSELRAGLAERQLNWAGILEKSELAEKLAAAKARSSLFSRSGALEPGRARVLTGAQLEIEIQDARTPMLLDVYATWCGPCKLIAPQLESLAAKLKERARVAKIDSDLEPQMSSQLRVQGLPTLIFYRDGAEVHRVEGVPGGADALAALVREHLGVEL